MVNIFNPIILDSNYLNSGQTKVKKIYYCWNSIIIQAHLLNKMSFELYSNIIFRYCSDNKAA